MKFVTFTLIYPLFSTNFSLQLPDATEVLGDAEDENSDSSSQDEDDISSMLLGHGTRVDLHDLHPSPLHIFKLWQTFLERVNCLTKIVHAPTVQQQILEAMSDLKQINKDFESLMFSIYCIALTSLQAGEVEKAFGESKKKLLSRCRRGAQQAFTNAYFLRTSSTVVLQAFILFLVGCMSPEHPPSTNPFSTSCQCEPSLTLIRSGL